MPTIYKVGGCVRDKQLGINSKDIDFTFVLNDDEMITKSADFGFGFMEGYLKEKGFEIFLSTPLSYTIRAKFPKNHQNKNLVADFVLARKEVGYIPNTRQPILELGTLEDDLIRRDFTVNAIAESEDGQIIDLFDGLNHIKRKILITPLYPHTTLMDDPLRVLRALRFSITKDFSINETLWDAMFQPGLMDKLESVVSAERIREEVYKMMNFDSLRTLRLFASIDKIEPRFCEIVLGKNMWLNPTFKSK